MPGGIILAQSIGYVNEENISLDNNSFVVGIKS